MVLNLATKRAQIFNWNVKWWEKVSTPKPKTLISYLLIEIFVFNYMYNQLFILYVLIKIIFEAFFPFTQHRVFLWLMAAWHKAQFATNCQNFQSYLNSRAWKSVFNFPNFYYINMKSFLKGVKEELENRPKTHIFKAFHPYSWAKKLFQITRKNENWQKRKIIKSPQHETINIK